MVSYTNNIVTNIPVMLLQYYIAVLFFKFDQNQEAERMISLFYFIYLFY